MTKRDLETRVRELETTLESRVAELESAMKAIGSRFLRHDGKRYIALPLTTEEDSAVRPEIDDLVSRCFGNGRIISGEFSEDLDAESHWEDTFSNDDLFRTGALLPTWDGYVARFYYTRRDGITGTRIWGLKLAK